MERRNWTEDETILAFYYYCKIPFGKISKGNKEIQRIAETLGRTPSAVSFKMGNLGHFDPNLQKRNVNGLSNASKLDEKIVKAFLDNWEELAFRAAQIEEELTHNSEGFKHDIPEGIDVLRERKERVNHDFFRDAVISSYGHKCCITGISEPQLLIASHIKPWAVSDPKTERTNPSNGLCLNAFHDKAFDRGLITIDSQLRVRVSSKLREAGMDEISKEWITSYDKSTIAKPEKFYPSKIFLEYHNDVIFLK